MVRKFSALLLAAALAGCAGADDTVPVLYKPTTATSTPGAGAVNLSVSDGRIIDRARISTKIGDGGVQLGAVRADRPVPDIVRNALKSEFEQRGFRVGSDGPLLTATVNRFYNNYMVAAIGTSEQGEVELAVAVTDESGAARFSKSYQGIWKNQVLIENASNAAESVAAALRDAVEKMFADPAFRQALTAS